jgi:hypothetical protein
VRRAALLLLLTASLLQADPALARVVATTHPARSDFEQGPSLEAGVLTWMETACGYCHPLDVENEELVYRVHVRYGDGRRAVLARGSYGFGGSGPNSGGDSIRVLASDSQLALEVEFFGSEEFEGDWSGAILRAGPFGKRPTRVFRCEVDGHAADALTALSGVTLAYEATPCAETSTLAVRYLTTGERWMLPPTERWIRGLDVEGRFLAMATAPGKDTAFTANRVTVLDLVRRVPAYEVELPALPPFESLDVGPDGSLAVRTGTGGESCEGEVAVYGASGSPAGRFAACRLVAQLAGRTVLVTASGDRRAIVEVASATDAARTVVRLGHVPLKDADADGDQLAWVVPTCTGGHAIHLTTLDGPARGAGSVHCPAALTGRRLAVSGEHVAARVHCPRGCDGVLRLLVGDRTVAARGFWARPRGISLQLHLRPWARRRLAAGPLTASARLRIWARDGKPSVVTRSVTLARP